MAETIRVYYNKLVRDNMPDLIKAKGEECDAVPVVDQQEFLQELFKKVKEEAGSLAKPKNREDFLQSYADLMVVLETLIKEMNITNEELERARQTNNQKKGGYEQRLFLRWSEDTKYTSADTPQSIHT